MIKLTDGTLVTSEQLKSAVRRWRDLSVMSQSSADALGAIVDLVAYASKTNPEQPDSEFSQASVDILRGFGWWPLRQDVVALVRNAVHLDGGLYVWDNPVFKEAVNGH